MTNLKNGFLNKVMMYKYPTVERMMMLFSSIILTSLPLICIIAKLYNKSELFKMLVLLIVLLVFCFVMYLSAFKTYICFDLDSNKITISKGLKKEEFSIYGLMSITVETDTKYPNLFSLNYNFVGYTKKDYSWSKGPSSRVLFGSIKYQRKRLEKFCEECNKYLNN